MRHYTVATITDDCEAAKQHIVADRPMTVAAARGLARRYSDAHPRALVGIFRGRTVGKLIETFWSKGVTK